MWKQGSLSLSKCDCLPSADSATFDTKPFGFACLKLHAKGLQVCIQHERWGISGLPRRGMQSRKWSSRVLFQKQCLHSNPGQSNLLLSTGALPWSQWLELWEELPTSQLHRTRVLCACWCRCWGEKQGGLFSWKNICVSRQGYPDRSREHSLVVGLTSGMCLGKTLVHGLVFWVDAFLILPYSVSSQLLMPCVDLVFCIHGLL